MDSRIKIQFEPTQLNQNTTFPALISIELPLKWTAPWDFQFDSTQLNKQYLANQDEQSLTIAVNQYEKLL